MGNPFRVTWNITGTIFSIIGFASTVERLADDGKMWNGFIYKIVDNYRAVTEPTMDFLLGWSPFSVPYFIGDIIFLYIMIGVAGSRVYAESLSRVGIFRKFIIILQWPMLIRTMIKIARLTELLREMQLADFILWASWLGAIFFGCAILFAINPFL